jgi:type I restriction enzyme S subunit
MSFESAFDLVSLGDVALFVNGDRSTNYPKGDDYVADGIPFISAADLSDSRIQQAGVKRISNEAYDRLRSGKIQHQDILFCLRGSIGKLAYVGPSEMGAIASSLVIVRSTPKIHPRYLYFILCSQAGQQAAASLNNGSAQPNLSVGELQKVKIPLPAISIQREITAVLDSLDDRITLLRETNTTLEAIAQALFKSWFVDFDPVHAKMQGRAPEGMGEATAALFPDSFEDSELGPVPKGWRVKTMADVSTVGIGKTPPRKEPQWFTEKTSDIRWVSIRDMGNVGVYASQTSEFLTSEAVEKFNVRVVPDNTTLMSFKLTVGRVALTDGEMTTNEAIAHFKLDEKSPVTSEFIYLYLKQFDFSSLSSTSSIAEAVNSKTVREIPILVPPSELIAAFQDNVYLIFNQLKNAEALAANLSVIRDTLLPRLISGQLCSSELESFFGEKVLSS